MNVGYPILFLWGKCDHINFDLNGSSTTKHRVSNSCIVSLSQTFYFHSKSVFWAWILDPYLIIHEKSQLIWAWNYTHGLDKIIHLSSLGFEIWQLAPMDQILVFQVNFKSTRAYCLFVKQNVDWGFVLGWCLINSTNVLIPYFHFGLKDTTIRFETGLHSSTNNIDKNQFSFCCQTRNWVWTTIFVGYNYLLAIKLGP